jgi:hypothetical protein
MKRRILAIVIMLALSALLVGCVGKKGDTDASGTGTEEPTGQGGQDQDELVGHFDEATRIYTTGTAKHHIISFKVPEGWEIENDSMANMDEGQLGDCTLIDEGYTQQIILWTLRSGYSDAEKTWDDFASVNDLSVGHYVTYGENKYYANEGFPDSDGAVMYYYEGADDPALHWNVQVKEGNEYLAEEILTSFTCK